MGSDADLPDVNSVLLHRRSLPISIIFALRNALDTVDTAELERVALLVIAVLEIPLCSLVLTTLTQRQS